MLTILEDIRTEAEKLWQAGIHEAETILRKAEEAIGMHKAATAALPAAPVADECATTTAEATLAIAGTADPAGDAEVLASPSADAAPAAEAAPAGSDPAPAAPQV